MRLRRHVVRIIVAFVTFIAGSVSYSYGAYYGGKFEAHLDLMGGSHSIRIYGTQDGDEFLYYESLAREYDVEVVAVAGCIVSSELQEKTRGYNEVMEASIEKRYGQGMLERLWRRARSDYQSKQEAIKSRSWK